MHNMNDLIPLELVEIPQVAQDELREECDKDEHSLQPDGFLRRISNTLQLNEHDPIRVVTECYDISYSLVKMIQDSINSKRSVCA